MKKKLLNGFMFIMILSSGAAIAILAGIGLAQVLEPMTISPLWATIVVCLVAIVSYILAILAFALLYDIIVKIIKEIVEIGEVVIKVYKFNKKVEKDLEGR